MIWITVPFQEENIDILMLQQKIKELELQVELWKNLRAKRKKPVQDWYRPYKRPTIRFDPLPSYYTTSIGTGTTDSSSM